MKYKTWRGIEIISLIIEIFLLMLCFVWRNTFGWIIPAGFVLLFMALSFIFHRCPHCGRFLGRSGGPCCRYCGKNMEEMKEQANFSEEKSRKSQ